MTQESLHSVVDGAMIVTDQIKVISDASAEQEVAINRIKDSITQISTVIQSNSATSEESAAASEELAGQAQILKKLIGKFQLRRWIWETDSDVSGLLWIRIIFVRREVGQNVRPLIIVCIADTEESLFSVTQPSE